MRFRPLPLALLAFAACHSDSTSTPQGPPVAAGWSNLPNGPVRPDGIHHMDVDFINADSGWMVDLDGHLYRTTDGGTTWTNPNFTSSILMRSVAFITPTHGFVGNLNDLSAPLPLNALFETLDGGATLTNISSRVTGPAAVGVCGMWALDSTRVFAVGRWSGPAIFLKTTDAGAHWTSVDLAPLATGIVDVYFTDALHGLIVGGNGVGPTHAEQLTSHTVVLGTVDGGASWQLRFQSTQSGNWAWKISFPNDSVGYVAEQGPNEGGFFLKTIDGGLTWTEHSIGTNVEFSGVGFATENIGWIAADSATFETTDGGVSWREVRMSGVDEGEDINRFRMLPNFIGYAVGHRVYKFDGTLSASVRRR